MINRKIYNYLHDFFINDKKALLLTGARQVGKTYTIRLYIKEIYDRIPSELSAQNERFILKSLHDRAKSHTCQFIC